MNGLVEERTIGDWLLEERDEGRVELKVVRQLRVCRNHIPICV
jgi:hypothetical protein